MDLRRPGMNLLDLGDLVAWLPPKSALHRAQDPDEWHWGPSEMLMALTVDEIRYLQYLDSVVNFKGNHKPPKPIPRPGVTDDTVKHGDKASSLPIDEMAEWLGGEFAALSN